MLLKTKVAIELFTDYDMLLFIENGVRGGISQCCNRYAKANNKYMSNFNPDDEIKYLMYLDANNLYGYAMSKYLPLKDFVWSDNNLTTQDILNLSDESDVGYILEVDLDYPPDLHDKHSDFPLAPENKPPPNCKEPRLLTTLEPKTKYVLHYSNLKLYLKLGDMKDDLNLYDTSDYDKNNVYNLPLVNKKVIGKMKDENKGNIMTEYQEKNNSTRPPPAGLQNNSTRPPPAQPAKQLNSTSACAACKTTQLDLRLRSLQNNSTRPPPAQPFAAESAFLTYLRNSIF
ncbi:uncharacterized protein NPIL_475471 [Nephila pilipes]|uniref:DNA-directed DNA polymerase n=2 Tax=Nephila pilipes TaxID=299642 RepID=A0A8X6QIZ0_NEPPI|nr:uncharacterized protein NPIL_475471 [Nephila pilipes]